MAIETLLCNNFCAEEVALKVRRTGIFAARKAAAGDFGAEAVKVCSVICHFCAEVELNKAGFAVSLSPAF